MKQPVSLKKKDLPQLKKVQMPQPEIVSTKETLLPKPESTEQILTDKTIEPSGPTDIQPEIQPKAINEAPAKETLHVSSTSSNHSTLWIGGSVAAGLLGLLAGGSRGSSSSTTTAPIAVIPTPTPTTPEPTPITPTPTILQKSLMSRVTEDATLVVNNQLELDNSSSVSSIVSEQTLNGQYGVLTIKNDGSWNYQLDSKIEAVQSLNESQTLIDHLNLKTTDGRTIEMSITIEGQNDQAVIAGVVTGTVTEDLSNTVLGQLVIADIDKYQNQFNAELINGKFGTLNIDANGSWNYTLNAANAEIQSLNLGKTIDDVINVKSIDGTAQTITIHIVGTNDIATIAGATTINISEEAALAGLSGQLSIADADAGEAGLAVFKTSPSDYWGFYGNYGSLTIDNTGHWNYSPRNYQIDPLRIGGIGTDTFKIETTTGLTQTLTINIQGENDAPTISIYDYQLKDPRAGVTDQTLGMLSVNDVDDGTNNVQTTVSDSRLIAQYGYIKLKPNQTFTEAEVGKTLTVDITATDSHGATAVKPFSFTVLSTPDAIVAGDLAKTGKEGNNISGQLTITDSNPLEAKFQQTWFTYAKTGAGTLSITEAGVWTYNSYNSKYLKQGELQVNTFEVFTTDLTKATVTVTVEGVNDAPSGYIGGAYAGIRTGLTNQVVASYNISDPDSLSTDLTYQINDDKLEVFNNTVRLKAGAQYDASLTDQTLSRILTVTDEYGANIALPFQFKLLSAPNAVITGDLTQVVSSSATVTGKLSVTDDTANEQAFVYNGYIQGSHGYFNITSDGNYSYSPTNYATLQENETVTDHITVRTADLSTAEVTFTITGINDAPGVYFLPNFPYYWGFHTNVNGINKNMVLIDQPISRIRASDPDDTDLQITMSDQRFSLVDNQLYLKAGSTVADNETKIPLTITATDPHGLSGTLNIDVPVYSPLPYDIQPIQLNSSNVIL